MDETRAKSIIGNLFNPEFSKEKDLNYALRAHLIGASSLLDAAILAAIEGKRLSEEEEFDAVALNGIFHMIWDLLGGYRDAVWAGSEETEQEGFRRGKSARTVEEGA